MNASPGLTTPLPAAAALYDGEAERKLIPACVHYAGSPRLLEKSFALQQQFAGRFDVCCDCEDGAAISNELAHAETLGRRAALQIADGFRVGARIHDPRHGATVHEALSLLTATAGRLAFLTIPKAESHAELTLCLDQLERAAAQLGLALPPVHVLIETHGALRDVFAIAADRRVEAVEFGLMDFISAHHGAIPTSALESPGQFDHPLIRRAKLEIAAAAHATGKVASHNVSLALDDPDSVAGDARRSALEFGFQRMWSIHPSQVAPILDAFRPGDNEIASAVAVLTAAQAVNWAPIRHAGRLHDRASYRLFWSLLRRAQADGAELPPAAAPLFGGSLHNHKTGVVPKTTGPLPLTTTEDPS